MILEYIRLVYPIKFVTCYINIYKKKIRNNNNNFY